MYQQPKTSLALPIVLIAGPGIAVIIAFVLGSVAMSMPTVSTDPNLFGEPSPAAKVLNIMAFLLGGVGVVAIVPCAIAGFALLSKRLRARRTRA